MNICIVIGKILKDIEFKFIYNSKAISIATCVIELIDKTQIEIFGFDEKADYMYRSLNIKDKIIVYGKLINEENKIKIMAEEIEKINSK